jgi:glutamate dehydrogenase
MVATIVGNPDIASRLVELFAIRFDPDFDRRADRGLLAKQATADIEGRIDLVESLNEDRVLRSLLRLVTATLRTSYYQSPVQIRRLALKLDPRSILDLPLPRPMFEIFVYSPRVEGVHLRGGPVARGGLRWSDVPRTSALRFSGWRRPRP